MPASVGTDEFRLRRSGIMDIPQENAIALEVEIANLGPSELPRCTTSGPSDPGVPLMVRVVCFGPTRLGSIVDEVKQLAPGSTGAGRTGFANGHSDYAAVGTSSDLFSNLWSGGRSVIRLKNRGVQLIMACLTAAILAIGLVLALISPSSRSPNQRAIVISRSKYRSEHGCAWDSAAIAPRNDDD